MSSFFQRNPRASVIFSLSFIAASVITSIALSAYGFTGMAAANASSKRLLANNPECFSRDSEGFWACSPSSTNQTILQFCSTQVCNLYKQNAALYEARDPYSLAFYGLIIPVLYCFAVARFCAPDSARQTQTLEINTTAQAPFQGIAVATHQMQPNSNTPLLGVAV